VLSVVQAALRHGGRLLSDEHVLSHRSAVSWWQRFWTPLWSLIIGGCSPTHLWLERLSNVGRLWEETEMW
ncbi:hypothetical protein L208DRAFT_1188036, partial [Tricholoma matsutake]